MKNTAICLILLIAIIGYGFAQIPAVCTDETSLRDLTCCPTTSDGVCGADAGRGACADLQLPNHRMDTTDVRRNWPHYYTRGCQCTGNFAGYDCSRCKFGYYGSDCSQYQVLPRREFGSFSDTDWAEFNRILNMTRTYDSGYVAVLEETNPGNTTLTTVPLSIYGTFVWSHHYAAKDGAPYGVTDYAHAAPGFYTWHRLTILCLEWQIQGMLLSMGDPNYHMFRVPYWDWRREIQMTSGIRVEDLFAANRLGNTRNESGIAIVEGDMYGNGWETICWQMRGVVCDPRVSTGLLQRCPFTGTNPCNADNPDWPLQEEFLEDFAVNFYDVPPYNITSFGGFRDSLDILNGVLTFEECRNDRQCQCMPSGDPTCANEAEITSRTGIHVRVHTIIGQGDYNFFVDNDPSTIGTYIDVSASPNDPIFAPHHAMLDCILAEWLRQHPEAEYPYNVTTIGHARDGFVVPFYPLFTHKELFVPIEELGYTCNLPGVPGGAVTTTMSLGIVLMLGAVAISLMNE